MSIYVKSANVFSYPKADIVSYPVPSKEAKKVNFSSEFSSKNLGQPQNAVEVTWSRTPWTLEVKNNRDNSTILVLKELPMVFVILVLVEMVAEIFRLNYRVEDTRDSSKFSFRQIDEIEQIDKGDEIHER